MPLTKPGREIVEVHVSLKTPGEHGAKCGCVWAVDVVGDARGYHEICEVYGGKVACYNGRPLVDVR